jgi:serine O-acetyltransferase
MFEYFKADLNRYYALSKREGKRLNFIQKLRVVWDQPAILAIATYRFNRWVRFSCKVWGIRGLLSIIGTVAFKLNEILYGIHIRSDIDIGPGLFINHFGCIFLGGEAKIGKNCNLHQEVTIGYAGRGGKRGLPVIGDNVFIGPGVKIIGRIKIGNNVAIGANAVVTKDLPDNAVAVGIPARVISMLGSKDFITIIKDDGSSPT